MGPDNLVAHNPMGVAVSWGAYGNVVEGNIIRDNDAYGVAVTGDGSSARINRNRIYDNGDADLHLNNGWRGIYIEGPAEAPPPPVIADFDLASGHVAGVTCPRCRVEVFSSPEAQGRSFAGSTVADGAGAFEMSRLTFEYDRLTATATEDETTGSFSEPTTGTQQVFLLQMGNGHPRRQVVGADPQGAFNGLGEMYGLAPTVFGATPEQFVGQAVEHGLTWERVSIDEFDFHEDWEEQTGRAPWSTYQISTKQQEALRLLDEHGFVVMYTLLFWDEAIEPYLDDPGYTRFADQAEIDRFISYTTFIVENVGQYIDWYEIWNEPETPDPGQEITAEHYVDVVEQVMPVIRALDPTAKVAVGATPHYGLLDEIIASDVISRVDGISWHPFYGNAPGLDLEGWPPDYWEQYPSILREIKADARASGFQGAFIAEEMNWRTALYAPPMGYAGHDPIPAAKYLARAIVLHRGMGAWSGLGESYTVHPKDVVIENLADLLAGVQPGTMTLSASTAVTDVVSYSLSAPDGELVALWDEGAADNWMAPARRDQIVTATLAISTGLEGPLEVTLIDPLMGVEQEAVFVQQGESLVLPQLVLKDYPVLVRAASVEHVYLPVVVRGG